MSGRGRECTGRMKVALIPVDGRVRVWRQRNTAFQQEHIVGTTAFGGGGVTVWGCFSLTCKIDLYVLDGTLTGQKYRDEILRPLVVPHFDCHPLASRPILMDDNARPHRARIAQDYLQQEAIELLPWPAMSPDMNPIEHLWDYLGRKVNARTPKCQNIQELRTALVQEWQQYPQHRLRRLIHGMRRRVQELYRKRGAYTRY
jgi:transposase